MHQIKLFKTVIQALIAHLAKEKQIGKNHRYFLFFLDLLNKSMFS